MTFLSKKMIFLSLLSQSQGEKTIHFSKSLKKIYADHFTDGKNIGQTAFENEEALAQELHSLEQAMINGQKVSMRLKDLGKILEKTYPSMRNQR